MPIYTNGDLLRSANERWAVIAGRIGAEHHESNQIYGLITQVSEAHEQASDALDDAENEDAQQVPWYAEQITYTFRSALQTAYYAAQTEETDQLRIVAFVGLHTDRHGVASLPQQDGSLLIAQIGDKSGALSLAHDMMRLLDGQRLYYAAELRTEVVSLDTPVALWHVPAPRATEWESWRERVFGPRDGADRRTPEERYAEFEQLRALADAHAPLTSQLKVGRSDDVDAQ